MKAAWRWLVMLLGVSLAAYFTRSAIQMVSTFPDSAPGMSEFHGVEGRILLTLTLLWFALFIVLCFRHKKKALWALLTMPLLYEAIVRWGNWICC